MNKQIEKFYILIMTTFIFSVKLIIIKSATQISNYIYCGFLSPWATFTVNISNTSI